VVCGCSRQLIGGQADSRAAHRSGQSRSRLNGDLLGTLDGFVEFDGAVPDCALDIDVHSISLTELSLQCSTRRRGDITTCSARSAAQSSDDNPF
jgi:hypothetical protein